MMEHLLFVWVGFAFLFGAAVGSWVNVCVYRLPYEKSLLWPGSHCLSCFQPVRWYDNIPLVSYWVLRGRCRACGATFSPRYFLVELMTGLTFAGLFYLDVVVNAHGVKRIADVQWLVRAGYVPLEAWLFWLAHAVLATLLIVTSLCDLDHMEIPLSLTLTGTLVGLLFAACFPWPWPNAVAPVAPPRPGPAVNVVSLSGLHAWPLWRPNALPDWAQPGTWQLGLATGLAGALAGAAVVRGVRFLFGMGRGVEGLGLGDADLMMMAGAFLGWQPIVVAFFVSVFPALVLGLLLVILRGGQAIPFGPSLALGTMLTLYGWTWIGPNFEPLFFDGTLMILLFGTGGVLLLLVSLMLRVLFGTPGPEPAGPDQPAA